MFFSRKNNDAKPTSSSSTPSRRTFEVKIVEARNVIACVKAGTSDPFATLSLSDIAGREIKSETYKTKTIKNTLSPVWNETCTLGNTYDLNSPESLPSLTISLFHKAQFTVSEVPMGIVIVQLDAIDPNGGVTDAWFPIEATGRMKTVSGELHLVMKFSGPPTVILDVAAEMAAEEALADVEVGDDGKPLYDEEGPNELCVTVLQAKRLPIMDKAILMGQGSSDPRVRIKIDGHGAQQTKYISKSLNPTWNEKLVFSGVVDNSLAMVVIVEDHNDFQPAKHMGRIAIQLNEFDHKEPVTKWYKLKNKTMEDDGIDRGEVQLTVLWRFNIKVKQQLLEKQKKQDSKLTTKLLKGLHSVAQAVGVEETVDSDSDFDPDAEAAAGKVKADAERPESDEEKKKKKEAEEQKMKDLNDIEIKTGDYQIQVHIIEARDLKAENFDGTSDPVVYAEVLGQKQNTRVIKGVTTCVFDELLIFNFRNVDKSEIRDAILRISCYDWGYTGNTMIGAFACDATMVYTATKEHELYRKWVPLMDDEDADDIGVQGYLKISISIIGPGDRLKIHDEEAEMAEEAKREAAAGGDIGSLMLSVPTVRKEWNYIVATVLKCEGLPVMDGKVGMGAIALSKAKTDAYCKLSFAGGKPLSTRPVTAVGDTRSQINPVIGYEMWYPVSIPTMTQLIKLVVLDHDIDKSEVIGVVTEKFVTVSKAIGSKLPIKWYNMYGAPEFKTGKALENVKKFAKELESTVERAAGLDIDWGDYYNNVPDRASSFKGRVLIQFRVEKERPKKYAARPDIQPFKRHVLKGSCPRRLDPPSAEYLLYGLIVSGTELPSFGNVYSSNLLLRVSIGIHEIASAPAKFEHGMVRWNTLKMSERLVLPLDLDQIPDIFIHLVNEDGLKPVCFYRMKPYIKTSPPDGGSEERRLIGFHEPAQWYLLQADKSIGSLHEDEFPGTVLAKIGFGRVDDGEAALPEWRKCLEQTKKGTPFQLRVHVYQCKDIPAADSNGLADPFLKVKFMGKKETTKVVKKNLFPGYYETLIFDEVAISEENHFEFASQVSFRVFDKDTFPKLGQVSTKTEDYLGTCHYPLQDAQVTLNPDDVELNLPKWYPFFKERPGDTTGAVLALVQLIPTNGRVIPKVAKSIIPPTRPGFVELVAIGIRDLAPFHFQEMQAPFMEIELNSFGSSYLAQTNTSKRPFPNNPNFLERIKMPVALPENSIFSTPLQIRVRDTRLGGYLKPVVGVSTIDLFHKIPWCAETYIPPASDIFLKAPVEAIVGDGLDGNGDLPPDADSTTLQMMELQKLREGELLSDDFIVNQEPINIDQYLKDRLNDDDTGAGVFGALNHIDVTGNAKKKKKAEDVFTDTDWSQDDSDDPPKWSVNRKKLTQELEAELQTTPFETYILTRGKSIKSALFHMPTLKAVGRFKGLVRITEDPNAPDFLPPILMDTLLKPRSYRIRLYCLRASALAQMDTDIFGNPADSDPYLLVKLGNNVHNDRENAFLDTKEADFYKLIEFDTELPGVSQLEINVMDKDLIGKDDLIGKTTIDLEDRWFDNRWQEMGVENLIRPGDNPNDKAAVRWHTKPVEQRELFAPNRFNNTGVLQCWVDIMTPEVSAAFPPDDVHLPPKQIFEVRVVIWKTKNVPAMDSLEGMSDLFVKVWPEGCKPQETDTHWRCKKGKASFNWRLLFDVELGHSTRAMKFPYLHLQLWDRDLLKWNDCAGEGTIDLKRYYRKAYKRNVCLKLFETKKGAAAKRLEKEKKKKGKKTKLEVADTTDDIPPDEVPVTEKSGPEGAGPEGETGGGGGMNPMNKSTAPTLIPERKEADSDDDDDPAGSGGSAKDKGMGVIPVSKVKEAQRMSITKPVDTTTPPAAPVGETAVTAAAKPSFFSRLAFWRKTSPPVEESKDGEDEKLLGLAEEEKKPEEKKEDDDSELKALITSFKNMTGLWDIDPEDSAWYNITNRDHNTDKVTPMGSICYSVQIWPKDKATAMPAGPGRSEPNSNPFCPPPVGRFHFSWNPFVLGSELCGPVLCAKLFCCFIFLAFITLMIFCQPFLNIIINLIFVVY